MAPRLSLAGLIILTTLLFPPLVPGNDDVMVEFQERDKTIQAIQDFVKYKASRPDIPRGELITGLVKTLQDIATAAQAELVQYLQSRPELYYQTLWLENEVFVYQVNQTTIDEILASVSNVRRVRYSGIATLPTHVEEDPPPEPEKYQHLEQIRAGCGDIPCLGKGVVVAFIGTGVMWDHSELMGNYLEDYGWFDPVYGSQLPFSADSDSGTHGAGLAVGKTKGVAPEASWMACLALPGGVGFEMWAKKCGEFVLCPCKYNDETDRNCSLTPDVVINSWQFNNFVARTVYYITVLAWNAVDLLHVFPTGSEGSACTTTAIPAIYDISFAVGSVNGSSAIPWFSSRGPVLNATRRETGPGFSSGSCKNRCNETSICTLIKPDITAPGENLNSSLATNATAYGLLSGTELSASVVGGVMALMVCANNGVRLSQTMATAHLKGTAATKRINQCAVNKVFNPTWISQLMCNEYYDKICEGKYPNNLFGAGEVDACAAVTLEEARRRLGGESKSDIVKLSPCSSE